MTRQTLPTPLILSALLAIAGCDCGGEDRSAGADDGGLPDGAAPLSHPGPCTIQEDLDADGEPESIVTLEYDELGQTTRREFDEGADGSIDAVTTFTYDGERLIEIAEDMNADGTVDLRTVPIYEDGLLQSIEIRDGEGTVLGRTVLAHDDDGNVVLEEIDDDADGTVDWRAAYAYDAENQLVREEIDEDADEQVDRIVDHEWDGDLLVRTTIDEGATGEPNRETRFHYDGLGNLVLEEIDLDADGTVDTLETRAYDGELLTSIERDVGADGSVDRRERFEYDESGNLLVETIDRDADDEPDAVTRFTYECF